MRATPPVIGVIVALVLALVFWFAFYKPAKEEQEAVQAETASLQAQLATLEAQIADLRDIKAREVEINAAMARLEEYIPSGPAQPTAIRQFQNAADAAGSEITSVTFGQPAVPEASATTDPAQTGVTGDTTLANIPVTVTVQGGYFQVVDFLRRLEVDVPRAVLVQSVTIGEATSGFPRLTVDFSGQIFAVLPTSDLVDTTAAPTTEPSPTPTAAPEG